MTVTEEPIAEWRTPVLRYKKHRYPVPKDGSLPRLYFVALFIGSRGSGKTHSAVTLLKAYERCGIYDEQSGGKCAQRVVLFSPTSDANPVFSSLQDLDEADVVTEYSDDKLLEVLADVKREREETLTFQRLSRLYKRFLACHDIDEFEPDELFELEKLGYEPPKPPKYPNGCVCFFVLDDLIGSSAFKATGKSALTNLVLKNRHLGVNILIMTQSLRAVPKSIRTNTSVFVVFRYASKRVITEDLYDEVSNVLSVERFEQVYDYATAGDHDALVLDFTGPKEQLLRRNFDTQLHVK